ncbi:MAG: sulfatase-like hydrolase/transferase [Pirellulales bacterium]|nr:sulfatase-like hydrolase/transferase [Pirellulales bacterium]
MRTRDLRQPHAGCGVAGARGVHQPGWGAIFGVPPRVRGANWLLAVACCLGGLCWAARAESRPPNIVLILADDLGWGDVGFNGRTEWSTPRLDRLAAEGVVFRRWYSGAVVCAPSRAVLMTGRYGIHNGVVTNSADLPRREVTLAEALAEAGYVCALYGKWHHGRPRAGEASYVHPLDQGFAEFRGFTNARHAWEQFPTQLWFGREQRPVQGHANALFTDWACEFIRAHRQQPFFLYLPYIATHFHIQAPAEEVAEHVGKFPERDPADPVYATYAAMVTSLDKQIGRVLDVLDELGLAEQTIVIFSSDHGATFEQGNRGASAFHDSNRPFRGGKRSLWEGGIRVPGLVRWKGRIAAGGETHVPVHMMDLFPTLLAAAGIQRSDLALDGIDLLPLWLYGERPPERTLFWEWRSEGYQQLAAMRGDLKLVICGGQPPELYNVETDPGERRSLHAEYPELTAELRAALDAWLATEVPEARQ